MPLREGPEFLRGHLGHPSARMSLGPDTKGGFSLGLPGVDHSSTACRLMTLDPKEARFSGQVPPVIPGAKRFPVGKDRLGDHRETAVRIYVSRSRQLHRVRRQGAEPNAALWTLG
jgi:hypothetical protein